MSKIRITGSNGSPVDMDLPLTIADVPTAPPPPPPATTDVWTARFFNGLTPTGTILDTKTYPGPALNVNLLGVSALVPPVNFSAVLTMQHQFAAGDWQWTVNSDDGFRLYVDDQVVPGLDGWVEQSIDAKTYTGHVQLAAGVHTITIRYFQKGGLAALKVSAPSPF